MQLKWQVAASSSYGEPKEMCGITWAVLSAAAVALLGDGTSGALICVYPLLGGMLCCFMLFNLQVNRKVQTLKEWGLPEVTRV